MLLWLLLFAWNLIDCCLFASTDAITDLERYGTMEVT